MKIYHNPRCSKSRQTLNILEETNQEVDVILYLKDTPTTKDIKSLLKKLKISAEQLVRKSEKIFKEKYKGKSLTEEQWIEVMAAHPILLERPIVIKGNRAIIGRPPENVKVLLS